jgi:Ca-activated chloride channel homolog
MSTRIGIRNVILAASLAALSLAVPNGAFSQSGRRKEQEPKPPANKNSQPAQASNQNTSTTQPSDARSSSNPSTAQDNPQSRDESGDVVRVTSNLVPVPATVVDSRGVALLNLKLEDFELRVDDQPKPISDLSRSETPVRLAMLFDNSGSLSEAHDFEKRAAVRFFRKIMRPQDQAAVYSVATDVLLAQPLTNDVRRLEQTIESFGKPEGATSLFDAVIEAGAYLRPFQGRRVIVILSDGIDTTSRADFDTTLQRALGDNCQIYVVQTGVYENANLRALAAERRMEEFASQTGGAVYVPKSANDLDSAFAEIAADLAQQYVLSYYPAPDKRDGRFHTIAVRVKTQPNARIRTRKGFLVKSRDQA